MYFTGGSFFHVTFSPVTNFYTVFSGTNPALICWLASVPLFSHLHLWSKYWKRTKSITFISDELCSSAFPTHSNINMTLFFNSVQLTHGRIIRIEISHQTNVKYGNEKTMTDHFCEILWYIDLQWHCNETTSNWRWWNYTLIIYRKG